MKIIQKIDSGHLAFACEICGNPQELKNNTVPTLPICDNCKAAINILIQTRRVDFPTPKGKHK